MMRAVLPIFSGTLGAFSFASLPRAGMLAATEEILALLSLLMAGLLPTMLLTATVLRAGGMSSRRVTEYGNALKAQMQFWTGLFGACLVGALAVIIAKIFGSADPGIAIPLSPHLAYQIDLTGTALAIAGMCLGIVIQRLPESYSGILSILSFNVLMAREEAEASDRQRAERFVQDATDIASTYKHAK